MANFLVYEQDEHVVTLTMDQPEVRNALTGNTAVDEFVAACDRIRADMSVRAVILTASGTVFSSGGNVKDMRRFCSDEMSPASIRQWYITGIQRLTMALYQLEVPTIAAVNGPAIGAGCDVACMCDLRIASEEATFAESFVRVGLIPGDGGAWLLPRAVGMAKAMEMALTGDPISAREALACGLVSQVVAADTLLAAARALAARIVRNPGNVLRMTKRLMREGQSMSLDSVLQMSALIQSLMRRKMIVKHHAAKGDKMSRAGHALPTFEEGRVFILNQEGKNAWVEPLINEILSFPFGRFDDQVDSVVQAIRWAEPLVNPRGNFYLI